MKNVYVHTLFENTGEKTTFLVKLYVDLFFFCAIFGSVVKMRVMFVLYARMFFQHSQAKSFISAY